MKRLISSIALAFALLVGSAFGQYANNNAQAAAVGPAGSIVNTSLLNITVSPGPVYCAGGLNFIHNSIFTLRANTTFDIVYQCPMDQVLARTTGPGQSPGEIELATVVCGATTCATITDYRSALYFPNSSDGYFVSAPGACAITQSGGTETVASKLTIVGSTVAIQEATTTTTATDTVNCTVNIPTRLTAGKGIQIVDVTLLYGNSLGAIGTCNAPTIGSFTAPAAGTSETPASATLVSFGGALTVTPVVGSCNTAAVTAGQYYSEKVSLGTPAFANTDLQSFYFSQSFVGPGSASFTLNVAGIVVHYVTVPV